MYCIVQTWLPAYLYDSTVGSLPTASSLPEGDVLPLAKILVADDQPLVRRTLRSLLAEKSHWKIYEAENGKVALECIQKENPQVAVLDIVMPENGRHRDGIRDTPIGAGHENHPHEQLLHRG